MNTSDVPVAQELSALSVAEVRALRGLEISRQQEKFAGSFADTILAWQAAPKDQIIGLSFYLGADPVGLVLLKRGLLAPDWAEADAATMHALKIAAPFQGKGLGRPVLRLVIAELKLRWPDIKELAIAVDTDNHAALALYRGTGMQEVGAPYMGRVGWELRLTLTL
ncbi:ribosomal-protein-alanine N-acetyltransferase [Roseovarius albus]|uniref:Ribosomal-protein-alanine N-acetyltransferase n=1 Tax=Roseovarius albus TaxID=1247867 RepID=A0A1X6YSA5_9RHOB|nr:GNAT family N-acetyltransferase [Roseovarius albus]SLN30055.1 ribosomal-protein-alanine N-acetyltransferase [Roseovarius albus]